MTKLFSIAAATLMLTLSVSAFQPTHAAPAYGQAEQTGPYAAGGSANPMQR